MSRAQSTIEYLAIIGAVITIALIATALITNFFGFFGPVSTMQNKQEWSIGSIAILEAIVDNNGDAIIVMKNNLLHPIYFAGYSIGSKQVLIEEPMIFLPEEKKTVFIPNIGDCEGECSYSDVFFHYQVGNSESIFDSGGFDLMPGKKSSITSGTLFFEGEPNSLICIEANNVQECESTQPDLSGYVPYENAITNLNLGANNLTSNNFVTNYVTENINIKDSFEEITSGVNNIGIGTLVFPALTTGSNNIGIGKNLSPLMTSGSNNIFIGTQTINRVTNSNDSVVIGIDALGWHAPNSQADRSVIIGKFAARGGGTTRQVNDSVIIGEKAGYSIGGGNRSVFVGAQAGQYYGSNTGYSVGIGYQSMGKNTANANTANYGTAIGASSLYSITTGNGNVATGYMAGSNITTTEYNTFIGTGAGRYLGTGTTSLTSATKGVFLGYNARGSANSQTNEIVIGHNAVGKGSNTVVIGNTSVTGLYLPADNYKLFFGAGDDASISYDGTNLVVNPKEVGSGILDVAGTLQTDGYNSADGTAGLTYNNRIVKDVNIDGTFYCDMNFKNGLLVESDC